jgi:hypothetical protein
VIRPSRRCHPEINSFGDTCHVTVVDDAAAIEPDLGFETIAKALAAGDPQVGSASWSFRKKSKSPSSPPGAFEPGELEVFEHRAELLSICSSVTPVPPIDSWAS